MIIYRKFLPEKEYVDYFKNIGKSIPPFIALMPYEVRDGVPGYLVPCQKDDPDAEEYDE